MLKALELIGFKSFADKTRFEFPPGITVVVGPNGSGKSNIVDAIKWVLGEQSAKSLRGKDMADVIFKGSGSGGRKPMNTAEATIIIDNSDHRLSIDAPEVHVTRRVYRSGEGEYLINRQPCRLKDIRDLFRGTGVGTDAYSLIEQGKVDQLLQASAKDRRAIFEEAAGISRFKAKKIEAQRRLERVDQNLLRLSDIVEEVESRLRSVRGQAAKARRYREYSEQLQQLRTQVGLSDWRHLTKKLETLERELRQLRDESASLAAHSEAIEARALELEIEIGDEVEATRTCEARIANNRERIAGHESTIQQQLARCREMEDEQARHRQQLAVMSNRAGDLQQRLHDTTGALTRAESDYREVSRHLADHERALNELTDELNRLRAENQSRRNQYVNHMRAAATLGNQVSAAESQLAAAEAAAERRRKRRDELLSESQSHGLELEQSRVQEQQLAAQLDETNSLLQAAQMELAQRCQLLARRQEELAQLHARHHGASERASILEELESQSEGLDAGTQDVLARARQNAGDPALSEVCGLVADLLHAGVKMAPLVDVALGEASQHIVVSGQRLIDDLQSGTLKFKGRVGFVQIDAATGESHGQPGELDGLPGVIGRADQFVETSPQYAGLARRLLGCTWFVEHLSHALSLSRDAGRGLRFVTRAGELLLGDQTLIVGAGNAISGIISRRSELRALRGEIEVRQQQISEAGRELSRIRENIDSQDRHVTELTAQSRQASAELADRRVCTRTLEQRFEQLAKQRATVDGELQAALAQQQSTAQVLAVARGDLAATEVLLTGMEQEIQAADSRIEQIDAQRQEHIREATAAKVLLAKSEQRLEGLRIQMLQFEEDQRERNRLILQAQAQLSSCQQRHQQSQRDILRATSEVAELYVRKETYEKETLQHVSRRERLAVERAALADELHKERRRQHQLEEQQHKLELAAGDIRHERNTLADRLREDYGIELSQVQDESNDPPQIRTEVEEQIATLRRKISNIGAVNLEALAELEDLEARFGTLSGQYHDLKQAKESLDRIITKINTDSRRLFIETLEAIRTNFQSLYRKAFGGGRADIVLEEGVDVLDAGVEIIATPPGKPSFNNSLLSGGEKALTAVSLLMAIFQYRPSPFCVLDEVDAPFDEANIGRFVDVLRDFLGWTKFIIVTHSKKTMTAATTLYGVTMQESGVSKRVSVRFDDVSDDGHISRSALERERAEDTSTDDERAA
jgi:chromosome segregation protein